MSIKIARSIEFYYDVISAHSWIMLEQLSSAEKHCPTKVTYIPVHAPNIMTLLGNKVPYYAPPLKKYFFHDIRFLGRLHNIPIKTPRNIDEMLLGATSSLLPQYFLTLVSVLYPEKLLECSRLLWNMLWVESRPIHDESSINEICERSDLPPTVMNQLEDEKWSTTLERRHSQAISRGCFGVPWLVMHHFDNSTTTYFGSDRWPLIRQSLELPVEEAKWIRPLFVQP